MATLESTTIGRLYYALQCKLLSLFIFSTKLPFKLPQSILNIIFLYAWKAAVSEVKIP